MKKTFTLLFFVFATGTNAFTQIQLKAQKTIGGNHEDILNVFALTKDGGMILAGSSNSGISGDKTEAAVEDHDFWFVKLGAKGQIQWQTDLDEWDKDRINAIEQTADGGYIAAGGTAGWYESDDMTRYEIFKLDSQGNEEWRNVGYSLLYCVKQTFDGGYIFGGSKKIYSGEDYETDYLLTKYDAHGNILWSKSFGELPYESIRNITLTEDGGFLLGGISASFDNETDTTKRVPPDYSIFKTDSLGNIQWSKYIGGYLSDILTTTVYTKDGGCLLAGSSTSNRSGDKTENNRGSRTNDYWVVKLNSKGKVVWDKTIGGSKDDNLTSTMQTKDGGYILGGYSSSGVSGDKTEASKGGFEGYDYWVVKLSRHGNIEWDKTIGTAEDDKLGAVLEKSNNTYVVGGYTYAGMSGDKTDTSRGYVDFWLINLIAKDQAPLIAQNNTSGLNTLPLPKVQSWVIYPNPAKDILHIQTTGKATITLTDQQGKTILTKTINGNGIINITQLPAGLYYVKNYATGEIKKILISK